VNTEFGGIVENELFCLNLARALELPVMAARSIKLTEQRALLVERYDRGAVEPCCLTPCRLVALTLGGAARAMLGAG
jgi:hypothetical protein